MAVARQNGLPVLAGFVVTAPASQESMEAGAEALAARGSGGARLVVSGRPFAHPGPLISAAERLAPRLVARSSTLLESSGEWAGAFTSYIDIGPEELPKAVAGCWASAFSVDSLERQEAVGVIPGSFPMAVLVQPSLSPDWGGVAELRVDGCVIVHAVEGSPAPLLQGWVPGETGTQRRDGIWEGALVDRLGTDQLDELARILRQSHDLMKANRCEWAIAEGNLWLLQLDTVKEPVEVDVPSIGGSQADWMPVVRSLLDAPGSLGMELVLPWAIKGIPSAHAEDDVGPADVDEAIRLSRLLTSEVWGRDADSAGEAAKECLEGLLSSDPQQSLEAIKELNEPDPELADRLMALVHGMRRAVEAQGAVSTSQAAWYLDTSQMKSALGGDLKLERPRVGPSKWEPLVAAVVLSHGVRHKGVAASAGLGAGRLSVIDPRRSTTSPAPRSVVYAPQALPVLSQILWDVSGLVTNAGSPAAHLFESARSLGVAAVTGVELPDQDGLIVAVDGFSGVVATLEA